MRVLAKELPVANPVFDERGPVGIDLMGGEWRHLAASRRSPQAHGRDSAAANASRAGRLQIGVQGCDAIAVTMNAPAQAG